MVFDQEDGYMKDRWVFADTHLCHRNIFQHRPDREGNFFKSGSEHDEYVCDMWNDHIGGGDIVYLLGDVAFNVRGLALIKNLPGRKVVIVGNHDLAFSTIAQHASSVHAMKEIDLGFRAIMTHIPLHDSAMDRWRLNIHGHMHDVVIESEKHLCVSLEQTGFRPVNMDEIRSRYA